MLALLYVWATICQASSTVHAENMDLTGAAEIIRYPRELSGDSIRLLCRVPLVWPVARISSTQISAQMIFQ